MNRPRVPAVLLLVVAPVATAFAQIKVVVHVRSPNAVPALSAPHLPTPSLTSPLGGLPNLAPTFASPALPGAPSPLAPRLPAKAAVQAQSAQAVTLPQPAVPASPEQQAAPAEQGDGGSLRQGLGALKSQFASHLPEDALNRLFDNSGARPANGIAAEPGPQAPGPLVRPTMIEQLLKEESGIRREQLVLDIYELHDNWSPRRAEKLEAKGFRREPLTDEGYREVYTLGRAKPSLTGQRVIVDDRGYVTLVTFAASFAQVIVMTPSGTVESNFLTQLDRGPRRPAPGQSDGGSSPPGARPTAMAAEGPQGREHMVLLKMEAGPGYDVEGRLREFFKGRGCELLSVSPMLDGFMCRVRLPAGLEAERAALRRLGGGAP